MFKQQLRDHLAQTIAQPDLHRWFEPLGIYVSQDSMEITVEFPHGYFAQWFAFTFKSAFEKQVSLFLGPGYTLRYTDRTGTIPVTKTHSSQLNTFSIDFPFGHEYTFDQFFTNQKNFFPLVTAKDIAKSREVKFNPLIIQGESGTGKTHLLRCMANELSKNQEKQTIFYGSVDDLAKLYETGTQDTPMAVRARLVSFQALFVDDMHLLDDYPQLAREILALYDTHLGAKHQMAFATALPLADCPRIPLSLKTRMDAGLMLQLSKPDLDVRLTYVQDHCLRKKIPLSKAQMLTLAQRYHEFRSLSGLLNKFQAFREFLKKDISEAIFENILGRSQDANTAKTTTQVILEQVCKRFKLDLKTLMGVKRTQDIVLARQIAMFLCREELGLSFPALGKLFGGKDHSTVLYAVKKVKELQRNDNVMKDLVTKLRSSCRQGGT